MFAELWMLEHCHRSGEVPNQGIALEVGRTRCELTIKARSSHENDGAELIASEVWAECAGRNGRGGRLNRASSRLIVLVVELLAFGAVG